METFGWVAGTKFCYSILSRKIKEEKKHFDEWMSRKKIENRKDLPLPAFTIIKHTDIKCSLV